MFSRYGLHLISLLFRYSFIANYGSFVVNNKSPIYLQRLARSTKRCSMQVFVANPNKSAEVIQILAGNKERLLTYLGDFHTDKGKQIFCCIKQSPDLEDKLLSFWTEACNVLSLLPRIKNT